MLLQREMNLEEGGAEAADQEELCPCYPGLYQEPRKSSLSLLPGNNAGYYQEWIIVRNNPFFLLVIPLYEIKYPSHKTGVKENNILIIG